MTTPASWVRYAARALEREQQRDDPAVGWWRDDHWEWSPSYRGLRVTPPFAQEEGFVPMDGLWTRPVRWWDYEPPRWAGIVFLSLMSGLVFALLGLAFVVIIR